MLYPINEQAMDFLSLKSDDIPEIMAETAVYIEKTIQQL
jgi:hypothetical protein